MSIVLARTVRVKWCAYEASACAFPPFALLDFFLPSLSLLECTLTSWSCEMNSFAWMMMTGGGRRRRRRRCPDVVTRVQVSAVEREQIDNFSWFSWSSASVLFCCAASADTEFCLACLFWMALDPWIQMDSDSVPRHCCSRNSLSFHIEPVV